MGQNWWEKRVNFRWEFSTISIRINKFEELINDTSDLNKNLSGFVEEMRKLTEKSSKTIENTSNLVPSIDSKVDEISKRIDTFGEIINKTNDRVERNEILLSNHLISLTRTVEENRKEFARALDEIRQEIKKKKILF